MAPRERHVTVSSRKAGPREHLELRDDDTGHLIALRPDVLGEGDIPYQTRNEAILGIARAARWRVESVALSWTGHDLAARILLASEEARIALDARAGSALRLALAAGAPVSIEDTAWDELERRAGPIPIARLAEFAAELDAKPSAEILRGWGQGDVA